MAELETVGVGCGLREQWMQRRLLEKPLKSLDQALREVHDLCKTQEALTAIGAGGETKTYSRIYPDTVLAVRAEPSEVENLQRKVEVLEEKLNQIIGEKASENPKRPETAKREARCFGCGEPGDFKRDCPRKGKSAGRQSTSVREAFCLCCGKAGPHVS